MTPELYDKAHRVALDKAGLAHNPAHLKAFSDTEITPSNVNNIIRFHAKQYGLHSDAFWNGEGKGTKHLQTMDPSIRGKLATYHKYMELGLKNLSEDVSDDEYNKMHAHSVSSAGLDGPANYLKAPVAFSHAEKIGHHNTMRYMHLARHYGVGVDQDSKEDHRKLANYHRSMIQQMDPVGYVNSKLDHAPLTINEAEAASNVSGGTALSSASVQTNAPNTTNIEGYSLPFKKKKNHTSVEVKEDVFDRFVCNSPNKEDVKLFEEVKKLTESGEHVVLVSEHLQRFYFVPKK